MPALEILAAVLLVLGSLIVFRVLFEALPFEVVSEPLATPEVEEVVPLKRAA